MDSSAPTRVLLSLLLTVPTTNRPMPKKGSLPVGYSWRTTRSIYVHHQPQQQQQQQELDRVKNVLVGFVTCVRLVLSSLQASSPTFTLYEQQLDITQKSYWRKEGEIRRRIAHFQFSVSTLHGYIREIHSTFVILASCKICRRN